MSMVQYFFTSTVTMRLIRTDSLTPTQLLNYSSFMRLFLLFILN